MAPGGAIRGLWGSGPGSGVNGPECAGKVRVNFLLKLSLGVWSTHPHFLIASLVSPIVRRNASLQTERQSNKARAVTGMREKRMQIPQKGNVILANWSSLA
jgi:hypothetical protein